MSDLKVPVHRRLGFRLALTVALMSSLVFAATGWLVMRNQQETLTRALTSRVLATTRSLAVASAPLLMRRDPELQLNPLVLRALRENPDLVEITILDSNGVVRGHRDLLEIGKTFQVPAAERSIDVDLNAGESAWRTDDQVVIVQPIQQHDRESGLLVARARVDGIAAAVQSLVQPLVLLALGGMVSLILLVVLMVARSLRPLGELRRGVSAIGAGDLSTRLDVRTRDELGMLGSLLNTMVQDLGTAQGELVEKARLDHELDIARDLQTLLLPSAPQRPTGYGLGAFYAPALEVSGDYYDVIPLPDGTLALVVADVSGKGVPGLVLMAMLRVVLRNLSRPGASPVDVLVAANEVLHGVIGRGMFITCIYGILDPESHRFVYGNAGHCPPIVYGGTAGVREQAPGGFALGMFAPSVFQTNVFESVVELRAEEGILLYTDGLVEAMDPAQQQLGLDPVLGVVHRDPDAELLVQRLVRVVEDHRQDGPATDDLTLLAVKREPSVVGAAT